MRAEGEKAQPTRYQGKIKCEVTIVGVEKWGGQRQTNFASSHLLFQHLLECKCWKKPVGCSKETKNSMVARDMLRAGCMQLNFRSITFQLHAKVAASVAQSCGIKKYVIAFASFYIFVSDLCHKLFVKHEIFYFFQ